MKILATVFVCSLLHTSLATADIGGFMSGGGCYDGHGTIPGRTCETSTFNFNQLGFFGQIKADLSYNQSGGVVVKLYLDVNDPQDKFHPDGDIGIVVRGQTWFNYGEPREYAKSYIDSKPLVLYRTYGTRRFLGDATFELTLNPGSETAEKMENINILLPGVLGVIAISF